MWLVTIFQRITRLFSRKSHLKIGLYGPPNGGKTTLANRICADWLGEEMGSTSKIAHETRKIQMRHGVRILHNDGRTLTFSLYDTPGLSSRIDYEDFVEEGLSVADAKARAKEAANGVVESIGWIGDADSVIVVLDATKEPGSQVNTTLLGNLQQRTIPVLILANKIDLKQASPDRIEMAFPDYDIMGVSAKYGDNIDRFYEQLFELTGGE